MSPPASGVSSVVGDDVPTFFAARSAEPCCICCCCGPLLPIVCAGPWYLKKCCCTALKLKLWASNSSLATTEPREKSFPPTRLLAVLAFLVLVFAELANELLAD